MTPIVLEWQKPAKGMEIIQAARPTELFGRVDNHVFSQKGEDASLPVRYEIKDLESPIVLRFINARRTDKLLGFMSTHGRVSRSNYVIDVEFYADELANRLLYSTNPAMPKERERWVNAMLDHVPLKSSFSDGRVVLHPQDLYGLMAMEVALAHEVGAKTTSCDHCETIYLTGPLTWRRAHSRFALTAAASPRTANSRRKGSPDG